MDILRYNIEVKNEWDHFISNSKNGHFMFYRDYMDYHSDRFIDFSLMVYDDARLIALLPANLYEQVLYSHQGLSFGGLVLNKNVRAVNVINLFKEIKKFLSKHGIRKIIYKAMPHIYYDIPSEEDLYVLFLNNANIFRRDISVAINLGNKLPFSELRVRAIRRAIKHNLNVIESHDFYGFWMVLEKVLMQYHKSKPVHTANEIINLASNFPEHIKLYVAIDQNNVILAGVVLYINKDVVHTQYLAASDFGRQIGALDLIMNYLINEKYNAKKFFDFGISTENEGKILNEGLIFQKEGFGARGIVHDFYEITL